MPGLIIVDNKLFKYIAYVSCLGGDRGCTPWFEERYGMDSQTLLGGDRGWTPLIQQICVSFKVLLQQLCVLK